MKKYLERQKIIEVFELNDLQRNHHENFKQ